MKKRRWFQFHISTLFILTLVASLLLVVNLSPRLELGDKERSSTMLRGDGLIECRVTTEKWYGYGWPWHVYRPAVSRSWEFTHLIIDLVFATAILGAVGIACEAWIARKQQAAPPS